MKGIIEMEKEIFLRVTECIEHACEKSFESISLKSSLIDDLEMDSLQLVMLQVALEEEFDYTFNPLEDNFRDIFKTVGSVCAYFAEKM